MRARACCGSESPKTRDRAEAGAQQAGQNAQQRGFARAVFAEQHVAAAGLEIHRDLAQRGKAAEELRHLIEPGAERAAQSAADGDARSLRSVCGGLG